MVSEEVENVFINISAEDNTLYINLNRETEAMNKVVALSRHKPGLFA